MLKGLLLKESLDDESVLDLLHITRTQTWQVHNAAPHQPNIWTALSFEVEQAQAEAVVDALSRALKPRGWFINASTAAHVFVLFPGKIFKYVRGDPIGREAAKAHGRTLDIPESQLDWSE